LSFAGVNGDIYRSGVWLIYFSGGLHIMSKDSHTPFPALKYDVEVQENGHIEFKVPFSVGSKISVFVIEETDESSDLIAAAQSSLDFWNNPYDDEDWNDAHAYLW
jgi:hypothetical protein